MWINMKDEVFRQAQVEELRNYYQVMDGLQRGIRLYSEENLKRPNPEWTGRLCWLMLRYGEASALAQIELDLAWQWAREGQMADALERLMFVSEEHFYRAAVYLLWQESQRMQEDLGEEAQPWSSQQTAPYTANAQLILDAVEDRVPAGVDTVDWESFTDPDFMALWGIEVSLIPDIQLEQMLARSYDVDRAKLIDHWCQRLLKLGSGSVSQDVEETDQLAYATEIRPYQLAELEMDLADRQLHQLAVEELAAQVEAVVSVESPVHLQSVCRRICEAVGIGRVGNRIREAVEIAAGWAEEQDWLYRQGDFLWHGEMVEIPIRDWQQAAEKNLDLIADQELQAAISLLAEEEVEDVNQLAKQVCRQLGFGRVSAEMEQRVAALVESMLNLDDEADQEAATMEIADSGPMVEGSPTISIENALAQAGRIVESMDSEDLECRVQALCHLYRYLYQTDDETAEEQLEQIIELIESIEDPAELAESVKFLSQQAEFLNQQDQAEACQQLFETCLQLIQSIDLDALVGEEELEEDDQDWEDDEEDLEEEEDELDEQEIEEEEWEDTEEEWEEEDEEETADDETDEEEEVEASELNTVVEVCCELVKLLKEAEQDDLVLTAIETAQAFSNATEDPTWQRVCVGDLSQTLPQLQDYSWLAEVCSSILEFALKIDDVDQTIQALDWLAEASLEFEDEPQKDDLLSEITQEVITLITVDNLMDEDIRVSLVGIIAVTLAKCGKTEIYGQLEEVSLLIEDELVRADVLSRVVNLAAEIGKHQKSQEWFDQALSLAEMIERADEKSYALDRIIHAMVDTDEESWRETAFELISTITDEYYREQTLSHLSIALAKAAQEQANGSLFDRAIELASELYPYGRGSRNFRIETLTEISLQMAELGARLGQMDWFDQSLEVVDLMTEIDRSSRVKPIYLITRKMAETGNQQQEVEWFQRGLEIAHYNTDHYNQYYHGDDMPEGMQDTLMVTLKLAFEMVLADPTSNSIAELLETSFKMVLLDSDQSGAASTLLALAMDQNQPEWRDKLFFSYLNLLSALEDFIEMNTHYLLEDDNLGIYHLTEILEASSVQQDQPGTEAAFQKCLYRIEDSEAKKRYRESSSGKWPYVVVESLIKVANTMADESWFHHCLGLIESFDKTVFIWEPYAVPSSLQQFAEVLANTDLSTDKLPILERALSLVDGIEDEDLEKKVDTLIELAETGWQIENPDLAKNIYQRAVEEVTGSDNSEEQAEYLSKIVNSLMQSSKDLDLIEQLRDQSLELGLSLEEGGDKEYLLSRLVSNFNNGVDNQMAAPCFQISLEIAAELADEEYQKDILSSIVENTEKLDQLSDSVEELLEQAVELAENWQNEDYRDTMLAEFSLLYAKLGTKSGDEERFDQGLVLGEGIQDERKKSRSILALAQELHLAGSIDQAHHHLEEGIDLLSQVQDVGQKTVAFLQVLKDFKESPALEALESVLSSHSDLIQSLNLSEVEFHYQRGLVDDTLPAAVGTAVQFKQTDIAEALFNQFVNLFPLDDLLDRGDAMEQEEQEEENECQKAAHSILSGVTDTVVNTPEGWPIDNKEWLEKLLDENIKLYEKSRNYCSLLDPMLKGEYTETVLTAFERHALEMNSEDKRTLGQYLTVRLGRHLAGAEAVEALQRNIVHLPAHYQLSHDWVNAMRVAQIKAGQFDYFDSINAVCPQLEWVTEETAVPATPQQLLDPYQPQSGQAYNHMLQALFQAKLEIMWELVEEGHLSEEVFQQKREALLLPETGSKLEALDE